MKDYSRRRFSDVAQKKPKDLSDFRRKLVTILKTAPDKKMSIDVLAKCLGYNPERIGDMDKFHSLFGSSARETKTTIMFGQVRFVPSVRISAREKRQLAHM